MTAMLSLTLPCAGRSTSTNSGTCCTAMVGITNTVCTLGSSSVLCLSTQITHNIRSSLGHIPANTRRSPNLGTMLGQSRRQRASIVPTLGERLVFAGILCLRVNTFKQPFPHLKTQMFINPRSADQI